MLGPSAHEIQSGGGGRGDYSDIDCMRPSSGATKTIVGLCTIGTGRSSRFTRRDTDSSTGGGSNNPNQRVAEEPLQRTAVAAAAAAAEVAVVIIVMVVGSR